jgi:signal transduction histidine kinase
MEEAPDVLEPVSMLDPDLADPAAKTHPIRQIIAVTATVLVTCGGALALNIFGHGAASTLLLGFFALTLGVVAARLFGNSRALVGVTLFLSAYTIAAVFAIIPGITRHAPPASAIPLVIAAVLVQWTVAAVLGMGLRQAQKLQRDLEEVRIALMRAQQLDDLKDQFISSVNHELRNPLMAMMNYVTVLTQRHETMAVPRRTQILHSLEDTGKRVIHLVGSILDVRQMTQHPEDFEPEAVAVAPMARVAASLLDPAEAQMGERSLFLRVAPELQIWGSDVYLQQILTNLLSNAVKYSAPGTPIEIDAHMTMDPAPAGNAHFQKRAMVEILVRDHGLGIPPHQLPLLFNRFVRLPRDLTSRTIGNGLGLYLCKVLAEAMGGRIWAESTGVEGEGTTFHLLLPAVPTGADADGKVWNDGVAPAALIAGFPAGRVRVAIGGIMAVILIAVGTLAFISRQAPGNPATGIVQFSDVAGGASNAISITTTKLGAPPGNAHYQAWMIDAANESVMPLGTLVAQGHAFTLNFQAPDPSTNLLGIGTQVEVTQERGQSQAPLGKIVLEGFFPPKSFVHVQHLLLSFPSTPGQVALLVGLTEQTRLLDAQAHQLQSVASHDPAQAKCLVLSMLNIVEGSASTNATTLPTTCKKIGLTGGDGFGLISLTNQPGQGYIAAAADHATLAIQQPDANAALHANGDTVIQALNTLGQSAATLDAYLVTLLAHPTDASQIATITALTDTIFNGQGIASTISVMSAYVAGQHMANLTLVP